MKILFSNGVQNFCSTSPGGGALAREKGRRMSQLRRRDEVAALVRGVLKQEYLSATVVGYTVSESVETGDSCRVTVTLRHEGHSEPIEIEGRGVGVVDAFCQGLISHFAREFESLRSITVAGFDVRAKMNTIRDTTGADAVGEVCLKIRNSDGDVFEFEGSGRSLIATALGVVVAAMEFFVNSERAFVVIHRAILDARARGRHDLVGQFAANLGTLVTVTSYSEIVERIRRDEGLVAQR